MCKKNHCGKEVKPEECTQDQIKECHGENADHPCEKKRCCEKEEKK